MIIDPALYSQNKSDIWWVIRQRSLPTAFKLYTGFALNLSFIIENAMLSENYLHPYPPYLSFPQGLMAFLNPNRLIFYNLLKYLQLRPQFLGIL